MSLYFDKSMRESYVLKKANINNYCTKSAMIVKIDANKECQTVVR
jgi:hypothetical protein